MLDLEQKYLDLESRMKAVEEATVSGVPEQSIAARFETQYDRISAVATNINQKIEREVGTLRTEMKAGFAAVNNRFEQVDQRFEQVDQRFEQVDQRFEQMDQRFEQVDQRFEQMDQRFEQVDQRFEQMDRRFDRLESSLVRIEAVLTKLSPN